MEAIKNALTFVFPVECSSFLGDGISWLFSSFSLIPDFLLLSARHSLVLSPTSFSTAYPNILRFRYVVGAHSVSEVAQRLFWDFIADTSWVLGVVLVLCASPAQTSVYFKFLYVWVYVTNIVFKYMCTFLPPYMIYNNSISNVQINIQNEYLTRALDWHMFNKTQQWPHLWPFGCLISVNTGSICHVNKSQKLQVR